MTHGRLYVLPAPTLIAIAALWQFTGIWKNSKDDTSTIVENLRQVDFINYTPGV
jgi:hypothetical protein